MPMVNSLHFLSRAPKKEAMKDNAIYLYQKNNEWHFAVKQHHAVTIQTVSNDDEELIKKIKILHSKNKINPLQAYNLELQIIRSLLSHNRVEFDYAEHYSIGKAVDDILNQHFPSDELLKRGQVELGNGMVIELGELYALMGDFFGIPNQPIAEGQDATEQQGRFIKAFDTLYGGDEKTRKLIKNILLVGAIQKQALNIARQNCQCVNRDDCACAEKALEEVSDRTNRLWNSVTGGSDWTYPLSHSTYLALAKNNIDHFSDSAMLAYAAGHEAARDMIRQIPHTSSEEEKKRLIYKALTLEASAGHFLTDLFSSGHVRVPRKELYNLKTILGIPVPSAITGLFTLVMHNEDGEHGVWVTDQLTGEAWKAYGDDTLLIGQGTDNRIKACTAARMAMLEIVREIKQASQTSLVQQNEEIEKLPEFGTIYKLFPEACNKGTLNHPLFKLDKEGNLLRRKDVNDPLCSEYKKNWWVWSTFLLILPKALAYAYPNWFSRSSLAKATKGQNAVCDQENSALKIYRQQKEIVTEKIKKDPWLSSTARMAQTFGGMEAEVDENLDFNVSQNHSKQLFSDRVNQKSDEVNNRVEPAQYQV
ncbi:phosphatidylcholine hydrolyzing phospholipase [Legionella londiniensis]|uniref:Phosphatidylcholine hydrolyzing phospholipase n=2 Tax=Legionella londiniensis TaxID=45068 RepID=A0A0W0VNT7_9GAMM|nr:hypothetical protein [Legionella londiniensis]KTD21597.1 phosphatidylcholine hydrolyzing phospholipase [Legionella londiniensis]STX93368.1 phosphatidylcholine hydrolyzing phospholipase [Legionella londiniensis]